MARVVVTSRGSTLLDESVRPVHLESEQSAIKLLDRLEWAIREADRRTSRPRRGPNPVPDASADYLTPHIGG